MTIVHMISTTGVYDKVMKDKLRPHDGFYWGLDERWHLVPATPLAVTREQPLVFSPRPEAEVTIWLKPEAPVDRVDYAAGIDQVVDGRLLVIDFARVVGLDGGPSPAV